MKSATFLTTSREETVSLGTQLGRLCEAGDVLLLFGELGAGKTSLIQGVASGLDVGEYTFSPSFVLVREYQGRLVLYHMDFYRMESVEEVADLGIDDYLYGDGVCAVEWADRGVGLLPEKHLHIELQYVPNADQSRQVQVYACGEHYERLLQKLTAKEAGEWN